MPADRRPFAPNDFHIQSANRSLASALRRMAKNSSSSRTTAIKRKDRTRSTTNEFNSPETKTPDAKRLAKEEDSVSDCESWDEDEKVP